MKTRIVPMTDHTVVEISGYIDFENSKPISESLDEIYKKDENSRIVLDFSRLEFVGSSGISTFVKSLRVFNKMRMKPSYFGVKSEFLRLFRAFEEGQPFEVFDNHEKAKDSALDRFQQWEARSPRSSSTH